MRTLITRSLRPGTDQGEIIMKKLKITLGSILAAVAIMASTSAFAAEPKELRFGLLPAEDAIEMVKQFQGIADHLGKTMGLPVKVWVSQSYNALIEAMGAGKLEVVYLGGGTYVAAKNAGLDVVPVVAAKTPISKTDKVGRTYYKSCIITRSDSGIKKLDDLKGKTFAFVTPTSTSGGVGPRFYLLKNGIDPEKDFKNLLYAGKHDAVYLAVKNGKVDAGAIGDLYFPRWKSRGILNYDSYDEPNDALIGESELYIIGCQKVPGTPMVTRKAFGKAFLDRLRAVFVSPPFGAVDTYRIWGPTLAFVPVTDADYADLAEMKRMASEAKKKKK